MVGRCNKNVLMYISNKRKRTKNGCEWGPLLQTKSKRYLTKKVKLLVMKNEHFRFFLKRFIFSSFGKAHLKNMSFVS